MPALDVQKQKEMKEYLSSNPNATPNEVATTCGVHYNTARRFFIKYNVSYGKEKYKKTKPDEQFKAVAPPFNHYAVNQYGVILHIPTLTQKIARINDKGYPVVDLSCANDGRKTARVHILVALAFVDNPDPEINIEVNHKNGDKTDPYYKNLEWVTQQKNMEHAIKTGLIQTKVSEEEVDQICHILQDKYAGIHSRSLSKIALDLDIPKTLIECISAKKTWKHITDQYTF